MALAETGPGERSIAPTTSAVCCGRQAFYSLIPGFMPSVTASFPIFAAGYALLAVVRLSSGRFRDSLAHEARVLRLLPTDVPHARVIATPRTSE